MKKVSGATRAVNKHCVGVMKLMSTFPLRRRLTGDVPVGHAEIDVCVPGGARDEAAPSVGCKPGQNSSLCAP